MSIQIVGISKLAKVPSWRTYFHTDEEGAPQPTTIQLFMLKAGVIDCDPIGQRLDVNSLTKKQGIIRSIISGNDICEIALRDMGDDTYRSIDGGHRKRSIKEFRNGDFSTGENTYSFIDGEVFDVSNTFYKDLPSLVRKQFDSYKLRFVVYGKEMTDAQAGETFRLRNLSTDVNHQEMLNSYEDNLVAKLVRETARVVPQVKNIPHPLFELYKVQKRKTDDTEEIAAQWFQIAPSRLSYDEFVARLLCVLLKNDGVETSSKQEIQDMYIRLGDPVDGEWIKDPSKIVEAEKALKDALDFVFDYAKARKGQLGNGLTASEATMLSRLYVYLLKELGPTFYIRDDVKFFDAFKPALDSFVGKPPSQVVVVYPDSGKNAAVAFKGHMGHYDIKYRVENTVIWFIEALGGGTAGLDKSITIDAVKPKITWESMGIVVKDKVRGISRELREQIWLEQGKICYVTKLPLDFADAVGAHIISHEKGGKTTRDNIRVVHKKINAEMGSTDLEVYAKMWQEQNSVAEYV